ncbi:probable glycosyl transferase [Crocosphaera subtropica ATCC 51142]|uniref:Probable glycosyl transferase n=1 Tax=Crocosphaera subtropica (strain ATCC 51142 / BH68) TaxID=43989 RepID=B1WWX1_CROS5|nr:sugar transferase [Crocosphaera subtropica]ACB52440.1 probable glycosyl transferase [Crocosphaera subtropica ATCC 51142]
MITAFQRLTPRGFQHFLPCDPYLRESHISHCSVDSKTKRLIDILGAIIGLLLTGIIAIPIFIAIQWDNPGPILYSQMRCGLGGKPFRLWKFRSMVINAENQKYLVKNEAKGHFFKNNKDPRITNIGYFLRRSSLDEFPQFWNVLMGDMSLVGTRPPTPDEVEKYNGYHWQRLGVKPGLTGEWQVNGRSTITDFDEVVQLDLNYQKKWSILYDLQLIFKTILVVFSCRGAY